jgi:Protein of unknown function (DUF3040)
MSLSPHDRHALDSITAGLAGSDPVLAGLLDTFSRLTAGESMPPREQIGARWRLLPGTGWPARSRPFSGRLGPARIMIFVWLLVTALLLLLGIVLASTAPAECNASPSFGCARSVPSVTAHPGPG